MNMTKEYEMEQISLAIAYFEEILEKECIRMEADKIRKTHEHSETCCGLSLPAYPADEVNSAES